MTAPALREVHRGRAADELILVDSEGRAILLRGDGLTDDERIRMRERAFAVLSGGVMTPEQQNGRRAAETTRRPRQATEAAQEPQPQRRGDLSVHQRFSETQGSPGTVPRVRLDDTAHGAVTSKAPQDLVRSADGGA